MQLTEVIRRRRMVRRYDPGRPVPPAVLSRVVQAGLRGPSAGFAQGVEFLVLSDPADVARYWDATAAPGAPDAWLRGMQQAPVLILVLSDPTRYEARYAEPDKARVDPWPVAYWDVDAGMGALLQLLTAVDEGLGACFFGVPGARHHAVREAFAIPSRLRLVGVVSLGYPAPGERAGGSGRRRPRRSEAETVHHGRY